MARPALDDEDEKPLDPAVEKVRRKLVRFVAINLGLLFVALIAVLIAVVYKSRDTVPPPVVSASEIPVAPGTVLEGEIPLPAGSRVVSQSLSGSRLSLDVELSDGRRTIVLYDLSERRVVGRFALVPQ